jgi:predicted aconitase with swiveling domain
MGTGRGSEAGAAVTWDLQADGTVGKGILGWRRASQRETWVMWVLAEDQ